MEQLCWKGREPAEPQHYAWAHSCSALLRQSYKALSLGQSRLFPGFSTQVFWCGKVQCNTVFVIFHLLLWSVKQLSPAVELELSFSALRAEAPASAQRCLVLPTTTQTETPGWWDCTHPTLSFNSSYPHLQSLKKTALLKERHHLLLHLLHVIQLTDHQRPQNSILKLKSFAFWYLSGVTVVSLILTTNACESMFILSLQQTPPWSPLTVGFYLERGHKIYMMH